MTTEHTPPAPTPRARFLDALVADPRSARAIHETLLDVREELSAACGRLARLVVMLRAMAALVRVGARVSVFEVSALAPGRWLLRLTLWTVVLGGLLVAVPFRQQLVAGRPPLLIGALIPQALCAVFPVSAFFVALWPPPGSRSPAGLQAIVAAALILIAVVATPAADQFFRTAAYAARTGQPRSSVSLKPGLPETSLVELARQGFRRAEGSWDTQPGRARRQFFALTGLMALGAALSGLGALISRHAKRRWPYAVAAPLLSDVAYQLVSAGLGFWVAGLVVTMWAVWTIRDSGRTSSDTTQRLDR